MLATLRDAVLGDFRPDTTPCHKDVTPEVRAKTRQARGDLDRVSRNARFALTGLARYLELAAQDSRIAPLTRRSRWMPSCATFAPR